MRRDVRAVTLAATGLVLAAGVPAAFGAAGSTALTIYSTAQPGAIPPEMYRPVPGGQGGYNAYQNQPLPGYAVVKQERKVALDGKRSTIRFTDVAALIDPTTVRFESLTDPNGTSVLDQSYQFDLVNNESLFQRFIDKEITVEQVRADSTATIVGTLLSASGGSLILRDDKGRIHDVNSYANVIFPELPEGLITRPTLVWDIATDRPGQQDTRVTYQTTGITWWADYNVVFTPGKDANSGLLDVGAWVSIINKSGASYNDAKLKLIAGDVHRAPTPGQVHPQVLRSMAADQYGAGGFQQKAFFEYHLYTLGRPATLPDNSTQQIELFSPATGVPAEKVLVYDGLSQTFYGYPSDPATDRNFGTQSNKKVDIYLRFRNDKKSGMGMPLPSGRIRVNQVDPDDGTLEFIGEDVIDHTPKDEPVLIKLGSAFDVVGERKQVDFKVDYDDDWMQETVEIAVRNHKTEPVNVIVKETMYRWANWKITESSSEYKKVDSRTVHFPVTVGPDGEAKIRYTVKYTW